MDRDRQPGGFTLVELMVVVAIIAVVVTIALPGLLQASRASYERNAASSVKTISAAQADFRANDRDGNRVNDFWTLDVTGLYTLNNWVDQTASRATLDLIQLPIAQADANPNPGDIAPANYQPVTEFAQVQNAKGGYWYFALVNDATPGGPLPYAQDTGGLDHEDTPLGIAAFNLWRFAVLTYPESTTTGKFVFLITQENMLYRQAISDEVKPQGANPPGAPIDPVNGGQINNHPTFAELKTYWTKTD